MLTAAELIQLKAKVKAEMQRRCYYGGLSAFASSDYDFSVTPQQGEIVLLEHGKKIIEPLLQICDKGDLNTETLVRGG